MFSIGERSEKEPVREAIQYRDWRRTFGKCVPRVVAHYPVEIWLWPSPEELGRSNGENFTTQFGPFESKNQEINRLQLAVKLPWAIFFESVDILSLKEDGFGVSFSYMFSHSKIKNEMKGKKKEEKMK
ncbi:hypothetical protein TNCV_1958581 [Trichonephila clavipes]|uniref:Uncharacterized protein n=1 Tax=Trichonephila clavipes TaxID=2585209 RepID=A0A8X6VN48_TRICX|nr:hypothetical protein TNCV_1958581 [Trichonephila clavipes]